MNGNTPDRIRILIRSCRGQLRGWQAGAIQALKATPGVELVGRVHHGLTFDSDEGVPSWRSTLYRRWVRHNGPAAWQRSSQMEFGLPVLNLADHGTAVPWTGTPPDLILDLAPELNTTVMGLAPPMGTWYYGVEEERGAHGGLPGLAMILAGKPACTVRFLCRMISGSTEQLYAGRFPVNGQDPGTSAGHMLEAMAQWPARLVQQYLAGTVPGRKALNPAPPIIPPRPPGNWAMLTLPSRARSAGILERTTGGDWNIGVLHQPIHSLLNERASLNIRYLPPPALGAHRRGPAGYKDEQGRLNVIYLKVPPDGPPEVARLRPKPDNVIKRSRVLLAADHTPSLPSIMNTADGPLVVIGNTGQGRVDLYRVDQDNDVLVFVSTLLNEPVMSPTLFMHAGLWWLMGTLSPWENAALHGWWSPSLDGPWRPHALNPLKVDIHSGRPAGIPFTHEGVLWRPAQDLCDPQKVHVVFNRVIELAPDRFHEETEHAVRPRASSNYPHGIGHIFSVGDITLVDGMRRRTGRPADP